MAKVLVIGANARSYKDKQTKEQRNMLLLSTVKNNANVHGKAVEEVPAFEGEPLYNSLLTAVKGVVSDLVGYFLQVDRDSKGFIENLEILEKREDAVLWSF